MRGMELWRAGRVDTDAWHYFARDPEVAALYADSPYGGGGAVQRYVLDAEIRDVRQPAALAAWVRDQAAACADWLTRGERALLEDIAQAASQEQMLSWDVIERVTEICGWPDGPAVLVADCTGDREHDTVYAPGCAVRREPGREEER